jgi:hypothetical protein
VPAVGYFAGRRLETAGQQFGYGARLPADTAKWPNIEWLIRAGSVYCLELDAAGEPLGLPARLPLLSERFVRASLELHRRSIAPAPEPAAAPPLPAAPEAPAPRRARGARGPREAAGAEG